MPVAAGISAAGALGAAGLGYLGSKSASQAQVGAQQQALQLQSMLGQQGLSTLMSMFNQAKGIAQPVIDAAGNVISGGQNALSSILPMLTSAGQGLGAAGTGILGQGQDIMGSVLPTLQKLLTPGPSQTSTLSQLPGFQFAQDWGQKAVTNQATTMGLGGNTLTAGANYATGLAQQNFGQYITPLLSLLGQGAGLTGTGVGALSSGAGALGTAAGIPASLIGAGLGTQGSVAGSLAGGAVDTGRGAMGGLNTLASTLGGTTTGIGQSQAQGILGGTNALSAGLTGAAGAGSNALMLSTLLSKLQGGGGGAPGIYGGSPETNALLNPATYGNLH